MISILQWKLLDFRRRTAKIFAAAILIASNKTTKYPKIVGEFERRFAETIGTRHSVTFSSGTAALEAAVFALNLGPDDEIIVPSYTIHSTFSAALTLGVRIKFADICPDSLTIDPVAIEKLITKTTKAIIVVHVWGNPADMDAIMELASKNDLSVIEDCSHCHGASWSGSKLGSIGDIGVFSLQGSKPIAAGEGGVLVSSSDEVVDVALAYGHQGRRTCGTLKEPIQSAYLPTTGFGRKYRAHPIGIALANVDLKLLEEHNHLCRKAVATLKNMVEGSKTFELQTVHPNAKVAGFYMGAALRVVSQHRSSDELYDFLKKYKIKVARRNHTPYHSMPHLFDPEYRARHLRRQASNQSPSLDLPNTDWALTNTLLVSLPQFLSPKGKRRWLRMLAALEKYDTSQCDI